MDTEISEPEARSAALLERTGRGDFGAVTRFHRELTRQWPEAYVFRLGESLEHLGEWMEAAGIASPLGTGTEGLFPYVCFDADRDGPRVEPEGGWSEFRWQGGWYRVIGVSTPGRRHTSTYVWVGCPNRNAAPQCVLLLMNDSFSTSGLIGAS